MSNSNSIKNQAFKLFALTLSLTTVVNSFTSVSAKPSQYNRSNLKSELNLDSINSNLSRFSNLKPTVEYSQKRSPLSQPLRGNNNQRDIRYNENDRFDRNNRDNWNNRDNRNNSNYYTSSLPVGTIIETSYPSARKILVTKDEIAPFTLQVTQNIRDNSGNIMIPRNSRIEGEIRPANGGSRFVAKTLILPDGQEASITANSRVISRTETVNSGRNTDAIWQGAAAGAAAATILSGITGDKAIATEEVLGGAGFGALAGFLFGGSNEKELISINTQKDLNLTLTSSLYLR